MSIDLTDWYVTYGPMVLRRCRALLRDEELAVDAMQDTFVRILRAKDSLHGDAPSSLLFRTATNVCLNTLRSKRRKPESPMEELLFTLAHYEDHEQGTLFRQLIGRIFPSGNDTTATIAVLHYVDGFTLKEVAGMVSMSVSGVRKRLERLKSRVAILEELHD